MKEVNIKIILAAIITMVIPLLIFESNKNNNLLDVFNESKLAEQTINDLIVLNEDKELVANKTYDKKFIYLAFKKADELTSYIIDSKTGEEKEFYNYIKDDKKEEFNKKINELLYLKYPNFIADVLKNSSKRTYEIKDNEMIIYFSSEGIVLKVEDDLFLKVNYNEIKDYLDFKVTLDSDYELENGYNFDKNKKTIAFSFDDGPNGSRTNKIVSLLKENKAHATFFMVGNKMEAVKETILNVLNNGNEIGSHSYDHKNMKRAKLEDIISGEAKTNDIYKGITGKDLNLLRPPYGNITKEIKDSLNMTFVNWNLDTEDWLHRNKKHIVDYVMENVSDGDIILMHDSYDSTVDAVLELLPLLYANGFQVVSISELANLKGINLEPHTLYHNLKEV